MKKKGSLLWTILTVITALLLVVCIVAIPVTNAFATAINVALGLRPRKSSLTRCQDLFLERLRERRRPCGL